MFSNNVIHTDDFINVKRKYLGKVEKIFKTFIKLIKLKRCRILCSNFPSLLQS